MNTLPDIIEALEDVTHAYAQFIERGDCQEVIRAKQALAQLKAAKVYSGFVGSRKKPEPINKNAISFPILWKHRSNHYEKPIQIIVIEGDYKGKNND